MERKPLDERIKFWSRLLNKAFPFVKTIIFDEKRGQIVFTKLEIDFFELSKYLDEELSGWFTFMNKNHNQDSTYFYLSTVFESFEAKDKAFKLQENIQKFFTEILMDHIPEEFKTEKDEVVIFFKFHSLPNE